MIFLNVHKRFNLWEDLTYYEIELSPYSGKIGLEITIDKRKRYALAPSRSPPFDAGKSLPVFRYKVFNM
jgi:hypothetical protein